MALAWQQAQILGVEPSLQTEPFAAADQLLRGILCGDVDAELRILSLLASAPKAAAANRALLVKARSGDGDAQVAIVDRLAVIIHQSIASQL